MSECIILIVDDDPLGRATLQTSLAREGYRILLANDGASALEAVSTFVPDLVLLDVMMPGMDGYEVTRRIRATPAAAEVPILLVTALDAPGSRLEGIEAGADDFLTKPVDRVELRARVRSITRLNRFRRLAAERERYRVLFDSAPCGLAVIDAELRLIDANPPGQMLIERVLGPGPTHDLSRLVPLGDAPRLTALISAARARPPSPPSLEILTRPTEQGPLSLDLTVTSIPGDSEPTLLVAMRDLTAQRLAEANLRHAQKLECVGRLASGVAHDFNNLLTAINGFSELAIQSLPPEDPIRELVEEVHRAGERAAVLTRQLLSFGRKQSVSKMPVDLTQLVIEVEKMLKRVIGQGIVTELHLSPSIAWIKADPGQIEQILVNLAVNARDAMPGGGTLTIETRDGPPEAGAPPRVRLIVRDAGSGMTPEVKARIFEPFFTTKADGRGTGLGLAVVYSIVQQHGAAISVESEIGQGSTFVIDFPPLETRVDEAPSPDERQPVGGHETILLCDDDAGVRTFARAALESAGYTVVIAADGADAEQISARPDFDIALLLTDVSTATIGGLRLREAFHRARPTSKVLLVSGDADARGQKGADSVRSAFLPKPFSRASLLRKVREVLDV